GAPREAPTPTTSASASAADAATARPAPAAPSPGLSELPEATVGQRETPSAAMPDSVEDLRRQKSSPLVRRIAKEHNVDIRQLSGTGISGRVTKNDILGFIHTAPKSAPTFAPGGASVGRPAAH